MSTGLVDAIRSVMQDKGINEELLRTVIKDFLLAAYKQKFGTDENAVVQFSDNDTEVILYAKKRIVAELEDEIREIPLENALKLDTNCELQDELLIEIDTSTFNRAAIQTARQKAKQRLREIQKDTLFSEFNQKVGELIIGYVQRERGGNIFVDLGSVEGILPKRFQSPKESYRPSDRIKALIVEVSKGSAGLQVILSRTHTDLVKRIFELEVPEIYNKTVQIVRIVRDPGYRIKLAVASTREDVDPVGTCVGLRGTRIQAVVRELEGERIDVLKYDASPQVLIRNVLSPAQVSDVIILDEIRKHALAIVPEEQLSLAIGKRGLNVRLANRLADWSIDVKTSAQLAELDLPLHSQQAVSKLFGEGKAKEEITTVEELPGITDALVNILQENNITLIEDIVGYDEDELRNLKGMNEESLAQLLHIIAESIEVVDENTEQEKTAKTEEINTEVVEEKSEEESEDVIQSILELPSMTKKLASKLEASGIVSLEDFVMLDKEKIDETALLTEEEKSLLLTILTDLVDIVREDED